MVDTTGGIPSGQKMSSNIDKNITRQKAFNKELDVTLQKANAILKAFGMPQMSTGGGSGGAGNLTTSGVFSGGTGTAGKIGASVLGVAAGAAQALPGVQEVLGTQLLTSQARFSGVGNPVALAQSAMRGGQATSSTDALEAMRLGGQGGLLGALPGFSGIMGGVSQLSNLTGSQTSAMRAAVGLNSAQSVNTMRMFGISVRGSNGAARPANEVFKDIYNFASNQIGRKLTPEEVAIGLQPGNGLANFLDAASAGNSDLRNALQMAAQQYAKGGDLSRSSTNKTGATTAAQGAQSNLFASKLGVADAAAPAMSKGYIEGAELLGRFNSKMEQVIETSDAASAALKQLSKIETIAGDRIGQSLLSVLGVIGASGLVGSALSAGKGLLGRFGAGLGARAAIAGTAGAAGFSGGPYAAAGLFAAGLIAPEVVKKVISGLNKGSTGLGQDASISGSSTEVSNVVASGSVIGVALSKQGTPYSWGGGSLSGPTVGMGSGRDTVGFDCSSFTRYVMGKVGIILPRQAAQQQQVGQRINPKDAQPGDLLFWGMPAHHVAIYMGNGMMIEAPRTGDVVKRTGVDLGSVTTCSRVLSGKTGTTGINNIMQAAGGYQASGNYGIGVGSDVVNQITINELRGSSPKEAMSGGTSSSSGLGFGDSTSPYGGSNSSNINKQYLTINTQSGKLESSSDSSGTIINYGGVTVEVNVPKGTQFSPQELSRAIKEELKTLPISVRVARS